MYRFSSISRAAVSRSSSLGQRGHVRERDHHVVDRGVGEVEDAGDHLALALGDLGARAAAAGPLSRSSSSSRVTSLRSGTLSTCG